MGILQSWLSAKMSADASKKADERRFAFEKEQQNKEYELRKALQAEAAKIQGEEQRKTQAQQAELNRKGEITKNAQQLLAEDAMRQRLFEEGLRNKAASMALANSGMMTPPDAIVERDYRGDLYNFGSQISQKGTPPSQSQIDLEKAQALEAQLGPDKLKAQQEAILEARKAAASEAAYRRQELELKKQELDKPDFYPLAQGGYAVRWGQNLSLREPESPAAMFTPGYKPKGMMQLKNPAASKAKLDALAAEEVSQNQLREGIAATNVTPTLPQALTPGPAQPVKQPTQPMLSKATVPALDPMNWTVESASRPPYESGYAGVPFSGATSEGMESARKANLKYRLGGKLKELGILPYQDQQMLQREILSKKGSAMPANVNEALALYKLIYGSK